MLFEVEGVPEVIARESMRLAATKLGIKTRLAGGIQAQAAFFDISRPLVTVDGSNRDVLAGESTYRGLEVSVGGELSRQWSLLASAVFLDAEITSVSAFNATELGKTPIALPDGTTRVMLEDGSFAITDQDGRYHFEGVVPGTHVVQVSRMTLPEGARMVDCSASTRRRRPLRSSCR